MSDKKLAAAAAAGLVAGVAVTYFAVSSAALVQLAVQPAAEAAAAAPTAAASASAPSPAAGGAGALKEQISALTEQLLYAQQQVVEPTAPVDPPPPPPAAALAAALELLAAAHAASPQRPQDHFSELQYCDEMERWARTLSTASGGGGELCSCLLLSCRAQHLERFAVSRGEYAPTKRGASAWRAATKQRQAERIAELLDGTESTTGGFDAASVKRVQALVGKDAALTTSLGVEREKQVLTDAETLIFFEQQLEQFAQGKPDAKVASVVQVMLLMLVLLLLPLLLPLLLLG